MTREIETLLESEVKISYIDFAMSVIIGRALPDVRDGLKPVQRRILYSMRELGLLPNRPYRKCATVVGDVIGKYHPHGDQAVYEALVRMAQDFSLRYPLIDGQGNFGSIDGDPPAAYRYTESRLSKISLELMESIDEDTVDFVPNFDNRLKEPVILPAKFPNLLVNGSSGIAVGMATNIPPHNLKEIIDATIHLIDNPNATIDEILNIVEGPDFPTGGIVIGKAGIREAYETGKGKITIQGVWHIEEKRGQTRIVISEIPYGIAKSLLIERIAENIRNKKIEGISDIRDESNKEGIRVVLELKKGYNPEIVVNQLLSLTPLKIGYGIILLGVINNQPRLFNLRELIQEFINHRVNVVERRTKFRLRKVLEDLHIQEGYMKALDNIDKIIEIIKSSKSPEIAKTSLIEKFFFTEKQAQAILELRLQALTSLEVEKIKSHYKKLNEEKRRLEKLLESRENILHEIKKELKEIKEKYGDDRRTKIEEKEDKKFDIKELIPKEEVIILVTRGGYAKRIPVRSFRQQNRGGVGQTGVKLDDDYPVFIEKCLSHDRILFFTQKGRAFLLNAYDIQEASIQARGKPLKNIIQISEDEYVVALIPLSIDFSDDVNLVFVTEKGFVKRTPLKDFFNTKKKGVIACKLRGDDKLISVILEDRLKELVLVKSSGKALRIDMVEIKILGRNSLGVKGIKVEDEEKVVSISPVVEGKTLFIATERGFGKRLEWSIIRKTKRGGKGVIIQKITQDTGNVVKTISVGENDEVLLLTYSGNTIRFPVSKVRVMGKNAKGVILLKLLEGDKIIDLSYAKEE